MKAICVVILKEYSLKTVLKLAYITVFVKNVCGPINKNVLVFLYLIS